MAICKSNAHCRARVAVSFPSVPIAVQAHDLNGSRTDTAPRFISRPRIERIDALALPAVIDDPRDLFAIVLNDERDVNVDAIGIEPRYGDFLSM